jgi:hypothetical protein
MMRSINRHEFAAVLGLEVERAKTFILTHNAKDPIVQEYILEKNSGHSDTNSDSQPNPLNRIYQNTNLPEIFTKDPDVRLIIPSDEKASTKACAYTYSVAISSIVQALNSIDPHNQTKFYAEEVLNKKITLRRDNSAKKILDITLMLQKYPSVFMQMLQSTSGRLAFCLLIIAVALLVASQFTATGGIVLGAGLVAGAYSFFSTKKPGIDGGFCYNPVPDEAVINAGRIMGARF